jgi:hypothetical protein
LKRWLIAIAASLLLGIFILQLGDDPLLDGPETVNRRQGNHVSDNVSDANRHPLSAPDSPRLEAATQSHARRPGNLSRRDKLSSSVQPPTDRPAANPLARSSLLVGEPELVALLHALRSEWAEKDEVAPGSVARLTAYLRSHPASARVAAHALFDLPIELTAVRTSLLQALLDMNDRDVQQIIAQGIEEQHKARQAALPATREELLALLAQGTAIDQERAITGLRRKDLSDPAVLDYLLATAQDVRAPWPLRNTVIDSLGRVKTRTSGDVLLRLFTTATKVEERTALMRALGSHTSVLPHLRQTMLDHASDPHQPLPVRRFALKGLAAAPPAPSTRQALLRVLHEESDRYLRRIAIDGLRRYENDATTEALLRAHRLRETDEQVLRTIDRILKT